MKRSEMLLSIASELVHPHLGFPLWPEAQEMAEIILSRIEKEGMQPPFSNSVFQKNCRLLQEPHGNGWESEDGS